MLYRLLIHPLSLLPLSVLNGMAWLVYLLWRYVLGYRKQVILENIEKAFPAWSLKQKRNLLHDSYRHLAKLIAEGIKNLSISEKSLLKKVHIDNPELFKSLYAKGKHVILLSSHIENWEYFITAQNALLPHRAFGIGKKIKKGQLDQQINFRRERFGMRVINAKNYREILNEEVKGEPLAILTIGDQSPAQDNSYWMPFFGHETPFAFGAEVMAHAYDMAVVYMVLKQKDDGTYLAQTELLCEDPKTMGYGEITEAYVQRLERDITAEPQSWLWSHRRWKHPFPANMKAFKKEHKERFEKRFGG